MPPTSLKTNQRRVTVWFHAIYSIELVQYSINEALDSTPHHALKKIEKKIQLMWLDFIQYKSTPFASNNILSASLLIHHIYDLAYQTFHASGNTIICGLLSGFLHLWVPPFLKFKKTLCCGHCHSPSPNSSRIHPPLPFLTQICVCFSLPQSRPVCAA